VDSILQAAELAGQAIVAIENLEQIFGAEWLADRTRASIEYAREVAPDAPEVYLLAGAKSAVDGDDPHSAMVLLVAAHVCAEEGSE